MMSSAKRWKPHSRKRSSSSARFGLMRPPRRPVFRQRHVGAKADEFAAAERVGFAAGDVLLHLHAGDFIDVFEDVFQRAVLLQQRRRRLGADAFNAGDVVDAVADHRLVVDHLFRRDSPIVDDVVAVDETVAAKVQNLDVRTDDLSHVFVGGAKEDVDPALGAFDGDRRQKVVRLEAVLTEHRNAERLQHCARSSESAGEDRRAAAAGAPCSSGRCRCGRPSPACRTHRRGNRVCGPCAIAECRARSRRPRWSARPTGSSSPGWRGKADR